MHWVHGWGRGIGHMWGMGGAGGILGFLFLLGLLVLFALAAIWLFRRSQSAHYITVGASSPVAEPLDLARRRLAAGDITLEKYQEIREELRN